MSEIEFSRKLLNINGDGIKVLAEDVETATLSELYIVAIDERFPKDNATKPFSSDRSFELAVRLTPALVLGNDAR